MALEAGADPGLHLRIAMALYGDVTYDSRVQREAETLGRVGHSVRVFCLSGTPRADAWFSVVAHRPHLSSVLPDGSSPFLRSARASRLAGGCARLRWMAGYIANLWAWGRWAVATAGDVDVWHAHDLTGLLAVGPWIRRPCRLVYDSHEIFLDSGSGTRFPRPVRRLLTACESILARRAVALITVNEGYERVLRHRLRPRRTMLVRNCVPRWSPEADSQRLRVATGTPAGMPIALYHGLLADRRGIEQLIEAAAEPAMRGVHVVVLGFGPARERLEHMAREPRFEGRVHLVPAVPPGDLLEWVAGADVDVIALQGSTLNHRLCTPNKLWESLGAGVPVVVSDFPGMREVVLGGPSGPLGEVCDPGDPRSIADGVGRITGLSIDARAHLRARCLRAASERWNWEHESARLVRLYDALAAPRALRSQGAPCGRTGHGHRSPDRSLQEPGRRRATSARR